MKLSILIPFMYNGDRFPLFDACVQAATLDTKLNIEYDVCIHEVGPERKVSDEFVERYNIKYMFSYMTGIFHKAWAVNVGVKYLCEGEMICMLDADMVVPPNWIECALYQTKYCCGFDHIIYLNNRSTQEYLRTRIIPTNYEFEAPHIKHRSMARPIGHVVPGGIFIMPKSQFIKIKGIPEIYEGTYGGEDNAFLFKMNQYCGEERQLAIPTGVLHLYHEHRTHHDITLTNSIKYDKWTKDTWKNHLDTIKEWGNPEKYIGK